MEDLKIIWLLAIGLGLGCLLGYFARKMKQSPILGYLLAGFIIGPNSPGPVVDMVISKQLASIGITLIMFVVGLSFNWKDIIAVKNIALPGALFVSILSILFGIFYCVYIGEKALTGLVLGLAICVSSTVVVVKILTDQKILHTLQGHVLIGWTIVEDIISVFGLLLLPALVTVDFSNGNSLSIIALPVFWTLIKIILLGIIIYLFGEKYIERMLKKVAKLKSHELFTLAVLATTFLIAITITYLFGVSLALGAFIAGTIVGRTSISHLAAARAFPLRDVFAVLFFISVGMLLNPISLFHNVSLFLAVLFVILFLRPLLSFLYVKLAKYPMPVAITVGLANSQIGEYSFILAQEGSNLDILPTNAYDIVVASAFISIALNSLLFQLFKSYTQQKI